MDTIAKLLAARKHQILDKRGEQIATNLLAYNGGAPYIDARLSRFPSESDTDWEGDHSTNPPSLGRKGRAFLVNYARRIALKVNQYVFQTDVQRTGADMRFLADCTATGMSINQFMAEVSSLVTVCRWCWLGVDRPMATGPRSIKDREASGDRVYWQLYAPTEVVDWRFNASGELAWLLVEREIYDNSNPRSASFMKKVRYLYEPGRMTRMEFNEARDDFKEQEEISLGAPVVPFIACGLVAADPWWFDDIERIQRAIMDLLSSRDTQIFKAVFALLVVSQSFKQSMDVDQIKSNEIRRKIGLGNPLVESADESGLTRYLDAPSAVFQVIADAKKDLETSLYDIVGLNMSVPESRQVASAEAKQWDHMDPAAVLKERATLLEEIETKAVQLSVRLGGAVFKPYAPMYGKTFDISDFAADIAAITSTAGFSLPPKADRLVMRSLVQSFARRFSLSEKTLSAALDEIETWDPAADALRRIAGQDAPPPPPTQ